MRLTTDFWARAYLRRCSTAGCPAFLVRHGNDAAGALFIKINHLDGSGRLFGPAPAGYSGEEDRDRRFISVLGDGDTPEDEIDAYMRQQVSFDSDLWLIEVEDAKRRHFLEEWLDAD